MGWYGAGLCVVFCETVGQNMKRPNQKIQKTLDLLGQPPGTMDTATYVLDTPVRIHVERCDNQTQCGVVCDVLKVSATTIIARGVKFRALYEIGVKNLTFRVLAQPTGGE